MFKSLAFEQPSFLLSNFFIILSSYMLLLLGYKLNPKEHKCFHISTKTITSTPHSLTFSWTVRERVKIMIGPLMLLVWPIFQAQWGRGTSLLYMEEHLRTIKAWRGNQLPVKCQSIKYFCICNWRKWRRQLSVQNEVQVPWHLKEVINDPSFRSLSLGWGCSMNISLHTLDRKNVQLNTYMTSLSWEKEIMGI